MVILSRICLLRVTMLGAVGYGANLNHGDRALDPMVEILDDHDNQHLFYQGHRW